MSKRNFLVTSYWSWDHHNEQFATFTVEGYAEDKPIPEDTPLTPKNFPHYFEDRSNRLIMSGYIKAILKAQDGSTFGRIEPIALYEIKHMPNLRSSDPKNLKAILFEVEWLCDLDKEGEPIFNTEP